MSIQLLLHNKVPGCVFKIIMEYCGYTELNESIKNFNRKQLKSINICAWTNIKLSNIIFNYKNISNDTLSNNFYYRNKILFFHTPIVNKPNGFIISNINPNRNININIGINNLGNLDNLDKIEYVKHNMNGSILDKNFFLFMRRFENKIYEQIIKSNDLPEYLKTYKFCPFIKSREIRDEYLEEINEFDDNNIIGYFYWIKIKFTSKIKYYKFNYITEKFDKMSKSNLTLGNNYQSKFVLEPILRIEHKFKIIWIELKVKSILII
jgi:hypothetical protein